MNDYLNGSSCYLNNSREGRQGREGNVEIERFEEEEKGKNHGYWKNEGFVIVEACGKKHKIESNPVELKPIRLILKQEKVCLFAFDDDDVEFKFVLCNDSDMDLYNIEFDDKLGSKLVYERGSFKVDGCHEKAEVENGVLIGCIRSLKAHESKTITFECRFKDCR